VRRWAALPFGLLAVGAALVVVALLEGGAQLALVVVVPVVFGGSLEFVLGVLLVVAGLFCLPLAFEGDRSSDREEVPPAGPSASAGSGGLVLIGPVPIFFGSWKGVATRTRVVVAVIGALVLVAAVVALVFYRI
jgi:uncharacterized protein (TIGR00304 family)